MVVDKLPTLNQFWRILRNHDWTFEYSDDHSVWRRGSAELSAIKDIVEAGGKEYKNLFDEYSNYAWRKDNSINEPVRPPPTKEQQLQDLKMLSELANNLNQACDNSWSVESSQITHADQLWKILNPLSSMISRIRDIIDDKSKSPMWDTVAYKGYKRIKEQLDQI